MKLITITPKSTELNDKLEKDFYKFCIRFIVNYDSYNYNGNDFPVSLSDENFKYISDDGELTTYQVKEYLKSINWNMRKRDEPFFRLILSNHTIDFWLCTFGYNYSGNQFRVCSYSSKKFTEEILHPQYEEFRKTVQFIGLNSFPNKMLLKIKENTMMSRIESIKSLGNYYIVKGWKKWHGDQELMISLVHRSSLSAYFTYYKFDDWYGQVFTMTFNGENELSKSFIDPLTLSFASKAYLIDETTVLDRVKMKESEFLIVNLDKLTELELVKLKDLIKSEYKEKLVEYVKLI